MSETGRFGRFVLCGGISAAANILSRLLLNYVVKYEVAILLAYLIGMIIAFLLSRRFVFQSSSAPASQQFRRFGLVNIASAAQVWIVSVGLSRLILPTIGFGWHVETLAHVIGVGSPVIASYFLHRQFSFG